MIIKIIFQFFIFLIINFNFTTADIDNKASSIDKDNKLDQPKQTRYILFDVNPGEGFNLRRDVYLRMANMVKLLQENGTYILVLPPWNRLHHWRSDIKQTQVPWSTFFDLDSLRKHVSVVEFHEFLKITGTNVIDEVYYLQGYKEGWVDGKWEDKYDERECVGKTYFEKNSDGFWHWWFWGYDNIVIKLFKCISIQGDYFFFKNFILKNTTGLSVMLPRAEVLIHGKYSEWSYEYWMARRSMRFAHHLLDIASEFRIKYLDSNDVDDRTVLKEDWTKMQRKEGYALGGPYLAVHLRRQDFIRGHPDKVPSIKGAAKQIEEALNKHNLTKKKKVPTATLR